MDRVGFIFSVWLLGDLVLLFWDVMIGKVFEKF